MSQLTLEFSNTEDLKLVLSVAQRLNVHIISIKSTDERHMTSQERDTLLQKQANDLQFVSDVNEIEEDFSYTDSEIN